MKMRFIWVLCLILGCCGIGNAQYKANYQLAEKFREFALGGKTSMEILILSSFKISLIFIKVGYGFE